MGFLTRLLIPLALLLRWPLRFYTNIQATPSDTDELALDSGKPVCYVLATRSLSDGLTLEAVCKQHGLPRPYPVGRQLPTEGRAGVVTPVDNRGRTNPHLRRLVKHSYEDPDYKIQLIPVSVFWGRSPDDETSLFRILFADSPKIGRLRKLLVVLANGRNTLVHFGQPLDYHSFLEQDLTSDWAARKLARVLHVHFHRQREATLGPPLSQRTRLINSLLAEPQVQSAIRETAENEGLNSWDARKRAADYAEEIAADHSNIAVGFMLRVLSWLWNRLYDGVDVRHLARLRQATHDYREVIYLPSHRSHMDYLLVSYILYTEGLALPQIAAGINLNFWPVGPLLRRCGAFYLRRSFKGNPLYTAVFRAYVDVIVHRGQPMKFYPEGGRSRTGRLLAPKTGMLSMAVNSALTHADLNVAIVPVYIGYDRVMEVNNYFGELRGTRDSKKESVGGLVRSSRRLLRQKYGRVYISFGEPIDLKAQADARVPDWRDRMAQEGAGDRPAWLHGFVSDLAGDVMSGINSTATLNAAGLVSLVLLGSPQKAMGEDELVNTLDLLAQLARQSPYAADVTAPQTGGGELLKEAEPLVRLQYVPHTWGRVAALDPRQAVLLTYTRNNVMHLFALPSLVANLFSHTGSLTRRELLDGANELYPLLASELSLRWHPDACEPALEAAMDGMLACGLLESAADGTLQRPSVGTGEFGALISLGRIVRESLERYAMTTTLLCYSLSDESRTIQRDAFEQQCQLMAERMAILTGRNSPEFFDQKLFQNQLQILMRIGYLNEQDNCLHVQPGLRRLSEYALQLLGPDIRQSISHLTSNQRLGQVREETDDQ